ncbi:transposase [Streptomyces sp. NPDC059753]|uniref:IS110 family transposase n=1 Tax=Streptomyces sp. NPDC059753 TaxID=3346933 RepID=UPI00364D9DE8
MIDTGDIEVFLGLDVGKGEHHATAVTSAGKKAFDKRLPNTEPKLRELFAKLQAGQCVHTGYVRDSVGGAGDRQWLHEEHPQEVEEASVLPRRVSLRQARR